MALFQAVPLPPEMGGAIGLFFEAAGADGRTRVLYLDSQDGYAGRDFHKGEATICATLEDFSADSGCEPTLAIGVDIDGPQGNPRIQHARQFKVGYPTRGSWQWDGSPGTFMLFTLNTSDTSCTPFRMNWGCAVWDGGRWVVQYDAGGCPKMFRGIQAAFPVHLGGARYKLYFNHHAEPKSDHIPQTDTNPIRVLYADGAISGHPALVDGVWYDVKLSEDGAKISAGPADILMGKLKIGILCQTNMYMILISSMIRKTVTVRIIILRIWM